MKKLSVLVLFIIAGTSVFGQLPTVSTFDQLQLAPDTFNNGSDLLGGFEDGDAYFINSYDTSWMVWSGFALSNMNDRVTPGYGNQYSTYATGGPARAHGNFMVGTDNPVIHWKGNSPVNGVYVCNTSYTALSMLNGDQFAKKFGGSTGDDPDYLKLTAKGYKDGGVTDTTFIYLADYTFSDNNLDYILDYWTFFDLSALGNIDSVQFFLSSTDNGQFGMNTPGFFCIEDFNWKDPNRSYEIDLFDAGIASDTFDNGNDGRDGYLFDNYFYPNDYNFDWGTWAGWSRSTVEDTTDKSYLNQYSAVTGKGHESSGYMISYGNSMIYGSLDTTQRYPLLKTQEQHGIWITNTTYAYDQILNGSNFSKKFGGNDGTDPDYFRLIIRGFGLEGEDQGVDTFYLADFRSSNASEDYIVDEWTYVPLACMEMFTTTVRIAFELQSSDTGIYGMNTPAYFAMDMFGATRIGSVQNEKSQKISVYPNPAHSNITIPLNQVDQWEIYGLDGKRYLSGSGNSYSIDVQYLTPGVYFIKAMNQGIMYTGKFVRN